MTGLLYRKSSITILLVFLLFTSMLYTGCSGIQKETSGVRPEVVVKEEWTEVGGDTYVFTSSFYLANSVLVTSGSDAVLIDTGENQDDLAKIKGFLEERKLKLKNIIVTHMHSDHSRNLDALRTDGMEPVTPKSAKDGQTIEFGDKTLRVIFTEGHYTPKGHLSVEMVKENILIAGDVICNNIIPPIAAGGDLKALLTTLKTLEAKNYNLIIPGHGEIADNELIFQRQFEYLENAKELTEKIIAAGGRMTDLNKIKLEDCIKDTSYLYKERLEYWHRASLEKIYAQLKVK